MLGAQHCARDLQLPLPEPALDTASHSPAHAPLRTRWGLGPGCCHEEGLNPGGLQAGAAPAPALAMHQPWGPGQASSTITWEKPFGSKEKAEGWAPGAEPLMRQAVDSRGSKLSQQKMAREHSKRLGPESLQKTLILTRGRSPRRKASFYTRRTWPSIRQWSGSPADLPGHPTSRPRACPRARPYRSSGGSRA